MATAIEGGLLLGLAILGGMTLISTAIQTWDDINTEPTEKTSLDLSTSITILEKLKEKCVPFEIKPKSWQGRHVLYNCPEDGIEANVAFNKISASWLHRSFHPEQHHEVMLSWDSLGNGNRGPLFKTLEQQVVNHSYESSDLYNAGSISPKIAVFDVALKFK